MASLHTDADPARALPLGTLWDDSADGWANEREELARSGGDRSVKRLRAFRRWYDRGMARAARPRAVPDIGKVELNGFDDGGRKERVAELRVIAAAEKAALAELSDFITTGGKDTKGRLAARLRFWFLQDDARKATRPALLRVARAARDKLDGLIRLRHEKGVGIVNGVSKTELQVARRKITPAAAAADKVAHYGGYATAYGPSWDFFVSLGRRPPYMILWDGFPKLSAFDRAATVFHEMTHLFMRTTDYIGDDYRTIGWDYAAGAYSVWGSSDVATADALNHADTWAGLVVYTGVPVA